MRKIVRLLLSVCLFAGLITSCNRDKMKVPEGFLSPDEMVPLLIDIHLVDGLLHQQRNPRQVKEDSAYIYYPSILKKHGVSRQIFDSTILFYAQYPEEFSKIYDEVMKKFSKMEGKRREMIETEPDRLD